MLLLRCGESVTRHDEKVSAFQANEGLEKEDRAAIAEELDEEEKLLSQLVDAIGHLVKLHGEAMMPFFDSHIAPAFAPFLAAGQPEPLQIVAVRLIDDTIEFGGAAAQKYIQLGFETFLRNFQSSNAILRQESVYGIAQIAKVAPPFFAQHLRVAVPALVGLISAAGSREEENLGATENALFALGYVCTQPHFRSAGLAGDDLSHLTSSWIRGLPLTLDATEAKATHAQLCDMVETGDAALFGRDFANLPEILRVMASVLSAMAVPKPELELAHQQTLSRMQAIVRHFAAGTAGVPAALTSAAFGKLTAEHQGVLQRICS